jgi:hypothetical protein
MNDHEYERIVRETLHTLRAKHIEIGPAELDRIADVFEQWHQIVDLQSATIELLKQTIADLRGTKPCSD